MPLAEREIEAQKELGRELREYAGQWVALRGTEIIAAGNTAEDVLKRLEHERFDRLFRVPDTKGSVLL